MKIEVYYCGHCDGAVSRTDKVCPHCSANFSTIRCPACRYVGSSEDFVGDRCPKCGCRRLIVE